MNIQSSFKEENALKAFRSGLNCAQAVMMAFQEEFAPDMKTPLAIAAGFGGGMGRLQLTCGSLTGAFMTIGQYFSKKYYDNEVIKDNSYKMIQDVHAKFIALHNVSDCRSLLDINLNQPKELSSLKEEKLDESICEKCVATAVAILEEEFRNEGKSNKS